MGIVEILLISVSLAMDAFAVSICRGLNMKRLRLGHCAVTALFFGGFQAAMPVFGYLLGSHFKTSMMAYDHWIAFVLLFVVGANMIREALLGDGDEDCGGGEERMNYRELLVLAIATSIDALAVGVTFAFLEVRLVETVTLIGIITFVLSFAGVSLGSFLGACFKKWAELAGGAALILIGFRILLEHLGALAFFQF